MGSELSEEFLVQVCVHQGSVLSPLLFATVVDAISENAKGLMNKILNAVDLVLMSDKQVFESKELRVSLKKTKVMVSASKGEVLKGKIDPCAKCG